MINLITDSRTHQRSSSNHNNNNKINTSELDNYYKLCDKYLTHMRFLKMNDLFRSPRKDKVLANSVAVYQMISDRQSNKRGIENSVDGEGITYVNNKVS